MLDVRPEERPVVGALIALSLLQGVSSVVGASVGKALFLDSFSPEDLPFAYGAVSLVLPTLGALFVLLSRRASAATLLAGTAAFTSVVYGGIWYALHAGWEQLAAAVAMVWVDVDWSLGLLVFLAVTSNRLDVRQQRRLLGVTASGDIVAGAGMGFLLPTLLDHLHIENLPLIAAGAQALAAVLVFALLRKQRGRTAAAPTPLGTLTSDRFLRLAWALLALAWFAFYVVDATFLSVAAVHYPNEDDLAGFLGMFMGSISIADAIASLGLYALILGRFGVLGGLLGGPLVTGVLAAVLVGLAGAPGALMVLGVASGLKLAALTAQENFTEPAVSTLYGALPSQDRAVAQALGSTVVGPIAGLLAAPALWLVLEPLDLGLRGLAGLALALIALTGVLAVGVSRSWPRALRRALLRGGPAEADVSLAGEQGADALRDGLMSPDPDAVVSSARMLREVAPEALAEALPELLGHRAVAVRDGAIRLLEEHPLPGTEAKLAARMVDEPDANIRGVLYRALVVTNPGVGVDLLEARVMGEDLAERGAAIDALIRHGDERADGLIDRGLTALRDEGGPAVKLAEHLAGRRRPLSDGELLARLTRVAPWELSEQLRRRRVGHERVLDVAKQGWTLLDGSRKARLATALPVVVGDAARPMLLRMLSDGEGADAALVALQRDAGLTEREARRVRKALDRDLAAAPALRRQAETRSDSLSRRALRQDAERCVQRAIAAYALLYPGAGLETTWTALESEDERPIALEILEAVLPREDWARLEPLLPGSGADLPIGEASEATMSAWTRSALADPFAAATRGEELMPLRRVSFLRGAPDRLLADLQRDSSVNRWLASAGADEPPASALPERVRDLLLIDQPDRRAPLLRALAGVGATRLGAQPGGAPVPMDDREKLVALSTCPVFAAATDQVRRRLVAASDARQLQRNQPLWAAEEHGESAVVVVSGTVQGRGAGTLFGVRRAIAPGPRPFGWRADNEAQVLWIPGDSLLLAAEASGAVAWGLAEALTRDGGEG